MKKTGEPSSEPSNLNELLLANGFSPVKAELWARFAGHAVALLDEAAIQLRETETWEAFCAKRGALSKPRAGKRSQAVERIPIEDAITSELGHIVRKLRATLPIDHFLRRQEVAFETEHLVESLTRAGRHSRKVDFYIYGQTGLSAPELMIEAKPILSPSSITSRYLAEDGIGCYLVGNSVYTRKTIAAMVAYTINKGAVSYQDELEAKITGYVPPPIGVAKISMPPKTEAVLCSRHDRSCLDFTPIAIIHLELLFAPDLSATEAT